MHTDLTRAELLELAHKAFLEWSEDTGAVSVESADWAWDTFSETRDRWVRVVMAVVKGMGA